MTNDGPVSGAQRRLAITALAGMASGILAALGGVAPLPALIVFVAALVFITSIAGFGVLTYRDARSSGSKFGPALARSIRTTGKALIALMP